MLGSLTLAFSTFLYLLMWQIHGPFWGWAGSSILLGLGYTFFSGATEAWLVDALKATNFKGHLESVFAKGQIVGGVAMFIGIFITGVLLIVVSQITNFWLALLLIFLWGLIFAAIYPIRQAYLNGLIPTEQRATVLSFDSLLGSSGGVVIQPALGKVADIGGYPASYAVASLFQFAALPFIYFARREKAKSDKTTS